jgi:flagellar biogenesis protein FliO
MTKSFTAVNPTAAPVKQIVVMAPKNMAIMPTRAPSSFVRAVAKRSTVPVRAVSITPLEMTRDGSAQALAGDDQTVPDAGRLNVSTQILRMVGALVFVLAIIIGVVRLLRRYNLIPQTSPTVSAQEAVRWSIISPLGKFAGKPPVAPGQQTKASQLPTATQAGRNGLGAAVPSSDPLKLLGMQSLPGGSAAIYLVEVDGKSLLLGTSPGGGVHVLSDINSATPVRGAVGQTAVDGSLMEATNTDEDEAADATFDDILLEQQGSSTRSDRPDLLALDGLDERLAATQSRLKLRMSTAAADPTAIKPRNVATASRRLAKNSVSKDSDL